MSARTTLPALALTLAAAALCLPPPPACAHSDRPEPIVRIDRLLENTNTKPLEVRRELRLRLARAQFSRRRGQPAAALADLERARDLGAQGRRFDYEYGLICAMLERDADALQHLNRFLSTGPPTALALNARARIHERAGRLRLAAEDYSASLALRDDMEVYLARGRVLESSQRCEEAARGYRFGLARLGEADLLAKSLVRSLVACHKYDEALATIDARIRPGRTNTGWMLLRGDVLVASGDDAGARSAREQALAEAERALAAKKTAILFYERARANAALGRFSAARTDLETVLNTVPRFQPAVDLARELELATGTGIPSRMGLEGDVLANSQAKPGGRFGQQKE